jgi:hypothetical protein
MRVEFTTEGGIAAFPGLSRPAVIDSADLPAGDAAQLEQLIDSARFFERPEMSRTLPKGAADYRQYTITIIDGRRHHSIRLTDPVEDEDLAALLAFLRRHATRPVTLGEEPERKRRSRRPRKKSE